MNIFNKNVLNNTKILNLDRKEETDNLNSVSRTVGDYLII